jgi:hypothetical protein
VSARLRSGEIGAGQPLNRAAEGAPEVNEPAANESQQNEQPAAPNGRGELAEGVRPRRLPPPALAPSRRSFSQSVQKSGSS